MWITFIVLHMLMMMLFKPISSLLKSLRLQFPVIWSKGKDPVNKLNWGDFVQGNFVHPILSFQFRAGKFCAHNEITCTGDFVQGNYVYKMKFCA